MPEVAKQKTWAAEALLAGAYTAVDLAKQAGADDVAATVTRHRGVDFEWRENQLEKVQEDATRSLSVALYVDGRYSTHVTHDLEPERLKAFLEEAVALTRHLQPDPHRQIPDPKLYEGRSTEDLDLVDPQLSSLDREDREAWCREMAEAASKHESVISATSQVADTYGTLARVTSNGFAGTATSTAVVLSTAVTIREGDTKRPEDHYFIAGTHREGLPGPADVGRIALERVLERRGAAKIDSTKTTMIVHPEAAAMLFARSIGALTGGAVQQRRSYLADKKGERIASDVLTVEDRPLMARALGSRQFDGEGIAAKTMPLIQDGVLASYYVDTYYARKLGWDPTTGSPSNLVFRAGEKDVEGIISGVEDGILVTSWLGGNANMTSGDYSYGVRGHVIRKGRRAEPISEMNVTGNYLELFERLVEVGNDPVPWFSCRTPTLVFDGIQFSGN